jgi:hypothetical protein
MTTKTLIIPRHFYAHEAYTPLFDTRNFRVGDPVVAQYIFVNHFLG